MNITEYDVLEKGLNILMEVLGKYHVSASIRKKVLIHERRQDAVVELAGTQKTLIVEAKSQFYPQHINQIVFSNQSEKDVNTKIIPLLITNLITEPSFDLCKKNKICVIDLSGNMLLDLPGIYIERYRKNKVIKDGGTSGTVFTAKASRIVRALLACPENEWTHSEIVEKTKVSAGYASRQIDKMKNAGYIQKSNNQIKLTTPDKLLDDWKKAYRFDRYRGRQFYAMNTGNYESGLGKMADSLKKSGISFAFTGWSGAYARAPYGTSNLFMAYVDRFPVESDVMFKVESGGNVILYIPQDEGVFQFATECKYGPVVSDAQLYVDLSKMPGRAEEQAEHLKEQSFNREGMNNA